MKNKTRKIIKVTCAILLIVLIQVIGVTYAKYLTTETGNGGAEVAKWSFEIVKNGEETKNIQLVNTIDKNTLVNGKIAPGTRGIINIAVDGTGAEVGIDYEVKFNNEKNKPSNLIFFYNGTQYNSLSEIGAIKGNISCESESRTREVLIVWQWKYETGATETEIGQNDKIDTQDANAITKYTFDVVATGTQSE